VEDKALLECDIDLRGHEKVHGLTRQKGHTLTLPGVSGGAVGAVETDAAGAEAELEVGAGAGEVDEESPPP
jgi:hypothetical protein